MSIESDEKLIQIESVDVDTNYNENASASEIMCDSGVETTESCSAPYPGSSDSDTSPVKSSEGNEKVYHTNGIGNESDSLLSSPISISPDSNEHSDRILTNKDDAFTKKSSNDEEFNDLSNTKPVILSQSAEQNELKNETEPVPSSEATIGQDEAEINIKCDDDNMKNVTCRDFMSSTISLNEQITPIAKDNIALSKSPYSRSAENISTVVKNICESDTSSNSDINADKVLLEFSNQKTKVSAVQKIPEQPQPNIDLRYARIPKELIPQDLGSIVKNVHGIFSTVSGSLKNAYNNTHRISVQKAAVKPITKPIPNGKVMNYIFEDENVDENLELNINGIEKVQNNIDTTTSISSPANSEQEGNVMDEDSKKDMMKFQVETLEKLLAEQRKENTTLRERVKQQLDELQEKDHSFKDLENKLDLMSKRVEQAEREKDAAVMRYCSVECAAIEAKRASEKAIAAEKAALHEAQLLNNKLKSAHTEKQRICQLYDDKCHELMNCEREVNKVREELRELEGRLKWTQSKLRMEMDAYKESAERAERLSQQVSELEAAAGCGADSARAKQLESELKESRAALILCRHERDELERRLSSANQQLEATARERDGANSALSLATAEVEQLKASNLRLEEEAAELAALRAQAALADTLSAQLQRETERCSRAEASLAEARALAETCARREAAALEHAARLTAQHVQTRAAAHTHHDQVQALTADNASLRERITSLEEECARLQASLTEETDRRNKENKMLARKVAELTEELADANKRLEWEKGENGVLKKKHASAIKELNRELHRALKRCEQLEAKLPPPDAPSTRTGSVTSLSSGEGAAPEERLQNGHADPTAAAAVPDIQVREPDKQALIERIVSLQRAAARRAERCEFLEEHSKQLTGELRAKSKLLRHLLSSMPAGAVASQDRDANKKEIARLGGGAMAAVWGGDPSGMTLELSLEMNRRLQAVLEDALLKNITLKENMDTLGAEISRLKEQQKDAEGKH